MAMLHACIRKTGPLGAKIDRIRAERIAAGLLKDDTAPVVLISQNGGKLVDVEHGRLDKKQQPKIAVEISVKKRTFEGVHYPAIAYIQRIVCSYFDLELSEMLSRQRHPKVVIPRQIGMFVAKKTTVLSLPEIGKRFGRRDHTTVLHAVRKIDELRYRDQDVANAVNALMDTIRQSVYPDENSIEFWGS